MESLGLLSLKNPARLASDAYGHAPNTLTEEVVRLRKDQAGDKEAVLLALCAKVCPKRTLVFFPTKSAAHRAKLAAGLLGMRAGELHGNLTQAQRLEALEEFRSGKVDLLFATDVAARGIDIPNVSTVVSFEPPPTLDAYLHRIGRTARAGEQGRAITIAETSDKKLLKRISKRKPGMVKDRQLPDQAVNKWRKALESVAKQIEDVREEERAEKEARKAEMEATKAENLHRHEREIFSRPRKTWFQTEKQKRERARQAKAQNEAAAIAGPMAPENPEPTKKKKRKDSGAGSKSKPKLSETQQAKKQVGGIARSRKKAERAATQGAGQPRPASALPKSTTTGRKKSSSANSTPISLPGVSKPAGSSKKGGKFKSRAKYARSKRGK